MEEKVSKFRWISKISDFERQILEKKLEKVDGESGKTRKSQGKVKEKLGNSVSKIGKKRPEINASMINNLNVTSLRYFHWDGFLYWWFTWHKEKLTIEIWIFEKIE